MQTIIDLATVRAEQATGWMTALAARRAQAAVQDTQEREREIGAERAAEWLDALEARDAAEQAQERAATRAAWQVIK